MRRKVQSYPKVRHREEKAHDIVEQGTRRPDIRANVVESFRERNFMNGRKEHRGKINGGGRKQTGRDHTGQSRRHFENDQMGKD